MIVDIPNDKIFDEIVSFTLLAESTTNLNNNQFSFAKVVGIDSDGDSISDRMEESLGTNKDNPDSDGDTVADGIEIGEYLYYPRDLNRNGIIDALDPSMLSYAELLIVQGNIKDESGNTLANSSVNIYGQTFTTDDQGHYQITNLQEGKYAITAEAEGYYFKSQTVQIDSENPKLNFTTSEAPATPILYFVIDDTGSMKDNIQGVKLALTEYIEILQQSIAEGELSPLSVLLTFKDQDEIHSRIVTNNLNELLEQVETLEAEGGDDCAEDSVIALKQVAEEIGEGGTALIATDAPPHEGHEELTALIEQLRAKGVTINVILTEAYCVDEEKTRKRKGSEHFEKSVEIYSYIVDKVGNGSSLNIIDRANKEDRSDQPTEEWLQIYKDTALNIMLGTIKPMITTVAPAKLPQGGTLDVKITASNSNFNKSSIIKMEAGIKINEIRFISTDQIIANITVPANSYLNRYDMQIDTTLADGKIETAHGIGVIAIEEAPENQEIISIISLQNNSKILISGINTNFEANNTSQDFGDSNIIVNRLIVHSKTLLEVQIFITAGFEFGLHDITVTTSDEIVTGQFFIAESNISDKSPPPPNSCDTLGDIISTTCQNQTLGDKHIASKGYVTGGQIKGKVTSEGWVSSVTILSNAILDGGIVTGYIENQGTIANIDYRGGQLTGGYLAGNITVEQKYPKKGLGVFKDVTLLEGAVINGGIFEGNITGKGTIKNAIFRANVKLSGITIGEGCILSEDLDIGKGVSFISNDIIPTGIELSADGMIDFNTDFAQDTPNLLTQINDLPEMQKNDWQLVQNNGQLEVNIGDILFVVIPKRIKQTNRPVQIIGHGKDKVTVITAQGREITVQLEVVE